MNRGFRFASSTTAWSCESAEYFDHTGRHFWARGYFVATSGNITDEVLSKYIEEQDIEPQDADDFKVTD